MRRLGWNDTQENPLPSWHASDRESYVDLLVRTCGCSKKTANAISEAFPKGVGLAEASPAQIRHHGATEKQAARLHAAFELARFVLENQTQRASGPLRSPSDVKDYLAAHTVHLDHEGFYAVMLDARQRVIDAREVFRGNLAAVDVHPRELFRDAVQARAHSMILAHNHPSGDPSPSQADINLTRRMKEVGELVGIPVLDHIIVARSPRGGYEATSLAALGLM